LRDLFVRAVALLALGAVLAIWSMIAIAVDAETTPFLAIAERVEAKRADDLGFLARVDRVLAANAARMPCTRDLMRSAVTIKLARLDGAYRKNYALGWADLAVEADSLLRNALHCFPHDGNLWLQLALVEFVRAGPTEAVEQMVGLSAELAPGEAWIALPRTTLAAKLIDFRASVREVLLRDAHTLVSYANPAEVAALYLQVGERARAVFDEVLAEPLDPERRAALRKAIDAIVATLPPERRP
jgi:hypothetical protein